MQCYLCGKMLIKNQNKTRDHVPPDCIFPDNKPANLLTLPCCTECNQKYQQLDEKMRDHIAILAGSNSASVGEKAYRKILGSRKWSSVFLSQTKEHPTLFDGNGVPYRVFYFDDNELQLWLIRIVKGLFYRLNRSRISDDAIFTVGKYPQYTPQPSHTFPMEKGLEFRPYFVYGVIRELNNDFWVLIFYDHLIFSVSVDFPIQSRN